MESVSSTVQKVWSLQVISVIDMILLQATACLENLEKVRKGENPLISTWPHLSSDVGLEEGEY